MQPCPGVEALTTERALTLPHSPAKGLPNISPAKHVGSSNTPPNGVQSTPATATRRSEYVTIFSHPNRGIRHPNSSTVDLAQLPIPQLRELKSQLDAELTHLSTSFQSLRTAQSKFRDCINSLTSAFPSSTPTSSPPLLVPLTSSLYVPGKLTDHEHVLVDVGTGFFVEKGIAEAKDFYERKVKDLGESLKDLEGVVEGKARNVRLVEEVMRVKVMNAQSQEGQGGGERSG
jgi:prefoldin alpha subunit